MSEKISREKSSSSVGANSDGNRSVSEANSSTHQKPERRGPSSNNNNQHQRQRDNNHHFAPRAHHGGHGGHMGMGVMNGMGHRAFNLLSGQAFSDNELMNDLPKKKFTGRCRLFVGNLPMDLKEEQLKELFSSHGEIAECYLSGKGFAFLRMDTRAHAESAKEAIDGKIIHNRPIRVRFAVHGAALRCKELSSTVSNEMLYHAFSAFGEVERAVHIVDEKGRPTGEGIVEFERKPSANEALNQIRDKVFLLTASPKPLVVEMLEPRDEDDGLAERMIQHNALLQKERELGPRFPPTNSFEYMFGLKWKELYETERQRRVQLEEEFREARRRLEADMEFAFQEYQTQMLREDLARRQQELERLEAAKRERMAQVAARRGDMASSVLNSGMHGGPPVPSSITGQDMSRGMPNQADMMNRGQTDGVMRGGADASLGRSMPQFHQGSPRPGAPSSSGGPDTTLLHGVQKLMQMFRSDGPGPGAGRPMPPVHHGFGNPNFMGPGGVGPMSGFGSGVQGGPFHRGPPMNDFVPSEKRMRR